MSETPGVQLPEAHRLPVVAHSGRGPSRLVPGVRQGTHNQFPIPTSSYHLHLDTASVVVSERRGTYVNGQL